MTSQLSGTRPLKIVVGAVTYPPDVNGAANFAHRLATGLARRGHEVHVICQSSGSVDSTGVEDGITVHRIGSYATPFHPTIRYCPPWRATVATRRLLAEIEPDVVHVQTHFFTGYGLIKAAKRRGIPLVATNHFVPQNLFGYMRVPGPLQPLATKILWQHLIRYYSKAQMVTAPTPRAVRLLRDNGFSASALPMSCGMDVDRYRRRAEAFRHAHPDPATRTVLFVGRLDEEKRVDELLHAMALLKTGAATRLEIIGDGSHRDDFEQLAFELGIGERVHFAGFVSDEELLDAYARADVFCMPSIAELQSLATMEAMSAGTPVVLANAMALPHLVESGRNGYLYPPGDVRALAESIDAIIGERAMIDDMGAASQRIVSGKHDIDAVLAGFESIYRQVMRAGNAALPSGMAG